MKTFRIIAAIYLFLFSIVGFILALNYSNICIAAFGVLALGQSIVMMPKSWGKSLGEWGKAASYAMRH